MRVKGDVVLSLRPDLGSPGVLPLYSDVGNGLLKHIPALRSSSRLHFSPSFLFLSVYVHVCVCSFVGLFMCMHT